MQPRRGQAWKDYHIFPKPRGIIPCPVCQSPMQGGSKRPKHVRLLTKDHIVATSKNGWPLRSPCGVLNVRFMCHKCNSDLPGFNGCVGALACSIAIKCCTTNEKGAHC